MEYPEKVIAVNKQGKKEARILVDKGEYIRYKYIDIKTGEETKKYTILLKNKNKIEHLFIVPLKTGKELVIKKETEEKERYIWDNKNKKIIKF